jgi:hypothetical protein
MPWQIRRNYKDCSGYAVVKKPDGELEGCHPTIAGAEAQMRALYASEGEMGGPTVKITKEWEGKELYDKLSVEEKALADALINLYKKVGPLNEASGIYVGYVGPEQNENNSIGVNCGNCALHVSEVKCAILSIPIQEGGACRFAVIPDGYVNSDMGKQVVTSNETPNKNPQGMSASTTYEKIDKATSLDALDLKPTESMANNARRGLELRSKFGRGGTAVGVARARDLANRKELSPETVGRMYSFFSRHEVDKKGKDFNNPERPSNGKIAWLLWGGDSGFAWARSKWGAIQRIRAQKSENAVWKESALSLEKFIDILE